MPRRIRGWLEALVAAMERRPDAGMCASQVRLYGEHRLDSAGMLVARDGSSKQRGHGRPPEDFPVAEEALFPSGSAALYRRAMLEADRRLRRPTSSFTAKTPTWDCARAGPAGSACTCRRPWWSTTIRTRPGGASPLKAYYVERNRLFVLAKNFPGAHAAGRAVRLRWRATCGMRGTCCEGRGSAARFRAGGQRRAEDALVRAARARRAAAARRPRCGASAARSARARAHHAGGLPAHLLRSHSISARRVAAL